LNVAAEDCLLLDDEPIYVQGARSLGMTSILVNRRLLAHDLTNDVICDLTALPTLLEQSGNTAVA